MKWQGRQKSTNVIDLRNQVATTPYLTSQSYGPPEKNIPKQFTKASNGKNT